jgi:hypothetical protein
MFIKVPFSPSKTLVPECPDHINELYQSIYLMLWEPASTLGESNFGNPI